MTTADDTALCTLDFDHGTRRWTVSLLPFAAGIEPQELGTLPDDLPRSTDRLPAGLWHCAELLLLDAGYYRADAWHRRPSVGYPQWRVGVQRERAEWIDDGPLPAPTASGPVGVDELLTAMANLAGAEGAADEAEWIELQAEKIRATWTAPHHLQEALTVMADLAGLFSQLATVTDTLRRRGALPKD